MNDLIMFLSGEKPLRAPTGNQLHDTTKAWTEMITGYIAILGLQNPRTYGPTYYRLPDVTLPDVANVGASGSTALATQNTGLISAGGGAGAGSLALLPQMNALAATYASAISDIGNVATNPVGVGGGGTTTFKYKVIKTFTAEETNQWFIDNVKPDYKPPYKPGTVVKEIELSENTTFVRVYDNMPEGSNMYGSWLMRAEDIEGLTLLEIQDKFALPNTPK